MLAVVPLLSTAKHAAIAVLLSCCVLAANALDAVTYGAFTVTATYSVANQLGFFTHNNLNVSYVQIPNSTYGYAQLLSRKYDLLTGTIDNAVNLRFTQHQNVTVLGQLDGGCGLVVASAPGITAVTDLKGKALIVDSPTSGYAYVLRKVLGLFGLQFGTDYFFQTAGSTPIRYNDLLAGSLPNGSAVYATILTFPYTAQLAFVAAPQTPNILATVADYIQPFTSSAFQVNQAALGNTTAKALLTRILASFSAANAFLAEPKNAKCAVAAIAAQLNVSTAVAQAEYAEATDPLTGETSQRMFEVNRQGLLNVIDVRGQFGGFANLTAFDFAAAIVPGPGQLIDYSVRDAVVNVTSKYKPKCS
ncbi:hypothetical protein MMC26_005364 [Xylographa opegraphella]|nr:hypothetical protein [Xylographa opegraphella]